ncbi:MAG: bifunctional DNA-formamidopyrimidine glycosylase/DNA-(apurinic or apyrimidinic site) lyase [Pseudomonadota bacterium]
MPELPEVETTLRGLAPHVVGQRVEAVRVRDARLRWPVPEDFAQLQSGVRIESMARRAKYLLWHSQRGTTLVHLGMSGSLRLVSPDTPVRKHDHVEWILDSGMAVRLHDPRRFGCVLWATHPETHPLLEGLGPEPLGDDFTPRHLFTGSRGRKVAVKNYIMDAKQVVGVGNIYASEALFRAGIHPLRAAGRISLGRYVRLVAAIQAVLSDAIRAGGTTLRDFLRDTGEPGYFKQSLNVYGRNGEPCKVCNAAIRARVIGQRSSFYCSVCQR